MKKTQIILVLAICLYIGITSVSGQDSKTTITNADVLELSNAGLSDNTIILALRQGTSDFDISVQEFIRLRSQNVNNSILKAMLQMEITNSFLKSGNSKFKETLTNSEIIKMIKNGVSDDVITLFISQSDSSFDTSVKSLINLKNQNVSSKVLDAMLRTKIYKNHF